VTLGKHGREHQPHHLILPHNHLTDFLPQLLIRQLQRVGRFFIVLKWSHLLGKSDNKTLIIP